MKRSGIVIALVALALCATSCSSSSSDDAADAGRDSDHQVEVAAAFYPIQWLVERIGGGDVDVRSITPEGTEPHEVSLDAKAIGQLREAEAVFYLGAGFQPEVEKAVQDLPSSVVRNNALEADGVSVNDGDPHVWMDPIRMQAIARSIAVSLKQVHPQAATRIDANLDSVMADLTAVDAEMRTQLAACAQKTFVTSHDAFGYLAERYGLNQLAISGISPEEEPDPKAMQGVVAATRVNRVTTIFFEEQVSAKLSETLAREVGAKTDQLSAAEFDPATDGGKGDYLSLQRDNAQRLAKGMGCAS